MDSNKTPNILYREQTFFISILKPYFTVQKDNSTVDMTTPVPDAVSPETHEAQSSENTPNEQITPAGENNQSSSSKITDPALNTVHPASVLSVYSKNTETSLTKGLVLKNYSDIFQGLGKFPGKPNKLRLKPDPTLPKHKP